MHRIFDVGANVNIEKFNRSIAEIRNKFVQFLGKKYEDLVDHQLYSSNYVLLGITESAFRSENIAQLEQKIGVNFERWGKDLAEQLLTELPKNPPEKIDRLFEDFMGEDKFSDRMPFEKIYHDFIKPNNSIYFYLFGENDYTAIANVAKAFKNKRKELAEYAIIDAYFFPIDNKRFTDKNIVNKIIQIFAPELPKKVVERHQNELIDMVRNADIYSLMDLAKLDRKRSADICETYAAVCERAHEINEQNKTILPEKLVRSGLIDFSKALCDEKRAETNKPPIEFHEMLAQIAEDYQEELRKHVLGFVYDTSSIRNGWAEKFCVLDCDQNKNFVQNHEMMHLVSFSFAKDPLFENNPKIVGKNGFAVGNRNGAFNELFTQYCALKTSGNPTEYDKALYDFYLPLVKSLFSEFEETFVESYMGTDLSSVYRLFGKQNVDGFANSLDKLMVDSHKNAELIEGFIAYDAEPDPKERDKIAKKYYELYKRYYDDVDEKTLNGYAKSIFNVKRWMSKMRETALERNSTRG